MIARREVEHNTAIIANQQTAGRGQFGRPWQAAAGGLYLSVVWQPPWRGAMAPLLTMAVAWALVVALRDAGAAVGLKWLNDLILERRKLGGILTETRLLGDRLTYVVVGVGINWCNPVPEGAIALTEVVTNLTGLHEVRAIALRGLEQGYGRVLAARDGGAALLQDYQSYLISRTVGRGEPGGRGQERGVIESLTPTGMAVVRWDRGTVSAHSPSTLQVIYSL